MPMPLNVTTVLLDVDGTLLDSNAAHAQAWAQALQEHGIDTDESRIRPLIGMGGDKLLPAAAGVEADSSQGRAMTDRKKELFDALMPQLQPTRGARALVEHLRRQGLKIVIATSAGGNEVSGLLQRAGVDDLIPQRTSSDDVEDSKPDPDVVNAALAQAGAAPEDVVFVGDTPYDIEAGNRAGIGVIGMRCGGYWDDRALRGALAIVDDPADLLARWR